MAEITQERPVAYFCAEYGLQAALPLYAGGLGVLAGDTVKEAADQNFPMVAVGLLYRGGRSIQKIDESGMQSEEDLKIDPVSCGFEHVYVPHEDQPLFVRVHLTKEDVWARVWKQTVNQTTIYLLDTDTDQNEPEERGIAQALYFGSEEVLIKQQMILGIGGVKLLDALNIQPSVYHINEGRPAFLYWQLIRRLMEKSGLKFEDAAAKAKSMIVYTNHTLVRAGNQAYDSSMLENYSLYYAEKMGVRIDELLEPGMEQSTGRFSMTEFALNTSRKASSVSQTHYDLSRNLWPEFDWVNVTNGVHLPTWQDRDIADVDLEGDDLWEVHRTKKRELMEFVQERSGIGYNPDDLILGWARRIAGYKRLNSLFDDVPRLAAILKHQQHPVQLVIAGKAHANDDAAKKILQQVIQYMHDELSGHAVFVPNYDIDVAREMVRGVDVWVNSPIQGQEASGTSGMKAISNGVLQLTVEDGWAAEVDWHDVGWTLDSNHLNETFYFRMEQDIVPEFYHRDSNNIPQEWLKRMKRSIEISRQYSTDRMLNEYKKLLYEA